MCQQWFSFDQGIERMESSFGAGNSAFVDGRRGALTNEARGATAATRALWRRAFLNIVMVGSAKTSVHFQWGFDGGGRRERMLDELGKQRGGKQREQLLLRGPCFNHVSHRETPKRSTFAECHVLQDCIRYCTKHLRRDRYVNKRIVDASNSVLVLRQLHLKLTGSIYKVRVVLHQS